MVGLLIAFFIARGIIGPLSRLNSGMKELAGGNFGVIVPGLDRKDEVGEMARTVQVFKKNGLEVERMKAEQVATELRTAQQRKADMVKMADDFENAVGEIVETVSSPARSPRPRNARKSSPPWSQRLPRKLPPMCSRWRRRPRS
jgi:HAMP domain-containing protein